MKTKGDARKYYLNVIDEATKKGADVAPSKNADYNVKFDYFLDESQKYIANIIKIPEVYQVTRNPIPNIEGADNGFELVQVLPDEGKIFTLTGCKSLYFEIDNIGTITISINGAVSETINNTVQGKFTAYSKLVPATSTDTVTVEFSGLYPYNIRNTGFYAYTFPTESDIPPYTPFVSIDMPSDFLKFDTVIIKTDPRIYAYYLQHKWESNKKIILNYYDSGSFDIHYYKYPADIEPDAVDTTVLDIEDKAFDLVALQCAVLATAADNPALSSWIRSLYVEKVQNISEVELPTFGFIQTVFSAE
jgi:hypothetical protein